MGEAGECPHRLCNFTGRDPGTHSDSHCGKKIPGKVDSRYVERDQFAAAVAVVIVAVIR